MIAVLVSAVLVCQLPDATARPPVQLDSARFVAPPHRLELPRIWRFHLGDDASWSRPELDDSGWSELDTNLGSDVIPKDWAGTGWFRLHLRLAPELVGRPMLLVLSRVGAVEIFADGQRVAVHGDLEAVAKGAAPTVSLQGDYDHVTFSRADPVIAVRFASAYVQLASQTGFPGGFRTFLGPADLAEPYRREELSWVNRLYAFFIGLAVALATLHLLLFVFMRDQKANLLYGLSTLSVASLSCFVILRMESLPLHPWLWTGVGFSVSLVCLTIFGVRFFHMITSTTGGLVTNLFYGVGVVLILGAWWAPVWLVYSYATLGLLEESRVVILAKRRRILDMWIIGLGLIAAVVMSMVQMLPEILGLPELWINNAYIYGFMALLLSMSIYLARSFGRTQRDLRHRLVEVRLLSEETIEQERRVKSEEMRRVRLEAENKRQSLELDEAKRRQEVMDQLEAANRELHEAQTQLVQSEKMASLGQLVAGIAHEINTPIGAIHSIHDSLSRATQKMKVILQEEAPELMANNRKLMATLKVLDDATMVIESGSTRVARIVQRLKTFARLDEADLQMADMKEGLQDTLVLLHHELKHDITVHTEYGEIPPISCYPGQLNQVFLNLLVNARQAIQGKGEIFVRTEVVDGAVHISIRDTGMGIPEDNLRKIFDPGFTTKGVKVGTGLGLSICYRIIQDHHGELRVHSEVGVGTTFTIVLPVDLRAPIDGSRDLVRSTKPKG